MIQRKIVKLSVGIVIVDGMDRDGKNKKGGIEMLETDYDCEAKSVTIGRCKRDYETEIKRAKLTLEKAALFRDAALNYYKGMTARDKMAELIGELVTECNRWQGYVDALILEQEADKG